MVGSAGGWDNFGLGCSSFGWVFVVVGWLLLVGEVVVVVVVAVVVFFF